MDPMIETKRVALEMAIRALGPNATAAELLNAAAMFENYMAGAIVPALDTDPHPKPHKAKADK